MILRDELMAQLNEYFNVSAIADYGPQGLQVEGTREVSTVVTAVSCSLELFERAAQLEADMIIVHHGLLWDRQPRQITGVMKRRLAVLFAHDINLVAYHLPLDAHPEIGHSVLIARGLGLTDIRPFGDYCGVALAAAGSFEEPLPVDQLASRVEALCGRQPLILGAQARAISTVAVASGGAGDMVRDVAAAGIECFITGEAKEPTQAYCDEVGMTFIEAGHYHSEKIGVIALGDLLRQRYELTVEFIDLPNPV